MVYAEFIGASRGRKGGTGEWYVDSRATSGLILIFDEINHKVFKYKLLHNRKRAVSKHLL